MYNNRDDDDETGYTQHEFFICVLARLLHAQSEGYSLAETVGHMIQYFATGHTITTDKGHKCIDPEDLIEAHLAMSSFKQRLSAGQLYSCRNDSMNVFKAVWGVALKRTLAVMDATNEDRF